MAKNDKLYWRGKGVITIGGKAYGAGNKLPPGELDPDRVKELTAAGQIGDKVTPIHIDTTGQLDALTQANAELQTRVGDLENEVADSGKRLVEAEKGKSDLENEVADLTKANAELTKQVADLTDPGDKAKGGGK